MLIDLVPEFLSITSAPDPERAYARYRDQHSAVLDAYWRNYVLDPDSPQAEEIIRAALAADRSDIRSVLSSFDLAQMVEETVARATDVLGISQPTDVYLMVGMGAANAGELVLNGRGAAFICIEHFTGRPNAQSYGMGLSPERIPLWVAHELAHTVRYTSPDSQSEMKRLVAENAGYYDFWLTGSRATLRELMVNEGLAVHASQAVVPGCREADYFGYPRRQYQRLREMESFLRRSTEHELDLAGLGLRLRYLTGGMSPAARLVRGRVIPERGGYYLGWRMAEPMVSARGIHEALRASARDICGWEARSREMAAG